MSQNIAEFSFIQLYGDEECTQDSADGTFVLVSGGKRHVLDEIVHHCLATQPFHSAQRLACDEQRHRITLLPVVHIARAKKHGDVISRMYASHEKHRRVHSLKIPT